MDYSDSESLENILSIIDTDEASFVAEGSIHLQPWAKVLGAIRATKHSFLKNFVVFEGLDGAGTSTQLKLLADYLATTGLAHCVTFEPTDTDIGRLIRASLKGKPDYTAETLARLFAADRHEHLFGKDGIIAQCKAGKLVPCDRYVFSSLVYQGLSCKNNPELPWELNKGFPLPELVFYFKAPSAVSFERIKQRGELDIFESPSFQEEVARGYELIMRAYQAAGCNILAIDATQTIEAIHAQIVQAIEKL